MWQHPPSGPRSDSERLTLAYQSRLDSRSCTRAFPLGFLSLLLGIAAAVGVPVFDRLLDVPGFVQGPILVVGCAVALLAIGAGIGALFVHGERIHGVVGIILGFISFALMGTIARL